MKRAINSSLVLAICLLLPTTAFASISAIVDVPAHCTVTDTEGTVYSFPQNDSSSSYLGICALAAAKASGALASFQLANFPGIGLYVQSLNGVSADPSSQYWALYLNDNYAACGLGCLPVSIGDSILLQLHDFSDTNLGGDFTIQVHSLTRGSKLQRHTVSPDYTRLSVPAAFSYLDSKQYPDGSFGSPTLSDWAALAYAAIDRSAAKESLRDYLLSATPSLTSVTDYERHAMALEAFGINPYNGSPIDSITPIVEAFDGTQLGDASLDTDDIFAIFPLLSAGYTKDDDLIQKTVAFIVSRQEADGSWDAGTDVTAAAIQALADMQSLPGVSVSLTKAEAYLHTKQKADGGFGNSYSTSWALQAIAALGRPMSLWTPSVLTPQDSLAALQQSDGGIEPASSETQSRVWATEYAIPASLGMTWTDLLRSFSRPAVPATSPVPTTSPIATGTPATATSTPDTPIEIVGAPAGAATTSPELNVTATSSPPLSIAAPSSRVSREQPKPIVVPRPATPLIASQLAAVAKAQPSEFFRHLWGSFISFFLSLR